MKPSQLNFFKRILVVLLLPVVYCQVVEAQNWMYISGIVARDIGVGRNGAVWATATNGNIFRWNGTGWDNIVGGASRVAVDAEGAAWVVNDYGDIYKYDNTTRYWELKPGNAKDIGIGGDGSVWIIGSNVVQGGYDVYKWDWTTSNWRNVQGGAVKIAVEPSGNAWIVNNTGNVLRYNGSSWEQKPGSVKDIGVGANGSIWCTGTDGAIYKWNVSNWQLQSGGATEISVGPDGNVWVVNVGGEVWRTNNPTRLPDFTKKDLQNVQHTLYSDLSSGKTVVLDFSAVWCGPCNVSAPLMQNLYTDLQTRKCNVSVYLMLFEGRQVGVECDSTLATAFATRYGLTLPIITNVGTFYSGLVGQFTSQYLQTAIPFFMIITPNTSDPGSSSIQILCGEYPDLVQKIESKLPATACRK